MKTPANLQKFTNLLGAILVFSVIIAFIMAGYHIATGNFHQFVNL
ncbi:MAG: hypothetical protein ACRYFL_00860 [Janthinobacterium lividum]